MKQQAFHNTLKIRLPAAEGGCEAKKAGAIYPEIIGAYQWKPRKFRGIVL